MYERLAPLAHDSLDEIPEPSETLEVIGHNEARRWFLTAVEAGKLPHAVILAGPRGIGKATFAFSIAGWLLAQGAIAFRPRDAGSALHRQIAAGVHPGVLHLTRPFDEKTKKFRTVITAEEIRRVGRFLSLRSHDGGYRVIIVDPADDMNRNAANALLKSLEEPPAGVLFILISHNPGRLLPTIRSRAQMIRLEPLADDDMLRVIDGFDAKLSAGSMDRAALLEKAEGSVRQALNLVLNGGLEIAQTAETLVTARRLDHDAVLRLADAVSGRDAGMQLQLLNQVALDRISQAASQAAVLGNIDLADRLANAWVEAGRRIDEAEAYNLDKRQHVIGLIELMRRHLAT